MRAAGFQAFRQFLKFVCTLTDLRPAYAHDVMLRLIVGVQSFSLVQIGLKRITFRDGVELPESTSGMVEMTIADRVWQWPVVLPNGAAPFDLSVECHDVTS